jgi:hypothetical protein
MDLEGLRSIKNSRAKSNQYLMTTSITRMPPRELSKQAQSGKPSPPPEMTDAAVDYFRCRVSASPL